MLTRPLGASSGHDRGSAVIPAGSGRTVLSMTSKADLPTSKAEPKKSIQRRALWLAVAIPVAAVIIYLLIWYGPDLIARHDIGPVTGPLRILRLQQARDAARGRLLTLGAGLFAAGALIFTALNFNLLRRNSERADEWQRRSHELSEQGQVTDRYTKAIEQLGCDKLHVCIGGVYALERIARDSARDHPTVMEALTTFIRYESRKQWPPPDPGDPKQKRSTRPNVQAAVTVVGRREAERDKQIINLYRANLTRANLRDANLNGATLRYVTLTAADLRHAKLIGADLRSAKLSDAKNLRDACLSRARLDGATWPADTPVPEGWERDSSGKLNAAGTGSGSAEAN